MIPVKIPFLAEGIDSGIVVSILVKKGDRVKKDDILLELETNKATAPIPSTADGVVSEIHVKEGVEASVGQVVVTLSESLEAQKAAPAAEPKETQKPAPEKQVPAQPPAEKYKYESKTGMAPPASPSVRKLAEQMGLDLTRVRGTERGGRITIEDVKNYVRELQSQAAGEKKQVSIDFSKWGPVTKKPLSPLRKTIGQKMHEAWSAIPHVTQFDEADITRLLEIRKKVAPAYEKKGAKLTLTGMILKGLTQLLKEFPNFNASLDEATHELVLKNYYHIGVAVDTEQGLIVPVLKQVDQKDLLQISTGLAELAEKTRQRKISIEETQGGSFTVSNLGSIGGTHFTPIVNRPEAAILGLGRGVLKPVIKNGKIEPRTMLPVCVSYDHRIIDGADGARFMKRLVEWLEQVSENEFKLNENPEKKTSNSGKKK